MGVAVETPLAEENDIFDIENEIDYPSHAMVNVARVAYPSWAIDTRNVEYVGPPHQLPTTADGSLDHHNSAPFGEASTSQLNPSTLAEVNVDFATFAADSLRVSLALVEEGSALQNAIMAALAYHTALIDAHHKKLEVSDDYSRMETRVTNALLRRFKNSTISNDDDDINDTPEEAARHDLIRRRKTRRFIERRKHDSEAKDSFAAPLDHLPLDRRLSSHHDFLAVQIFLVDLEDMMVRKDWGSFVEMWVFKQFEKGYKAHTAFHVYLKSGQGLQLNRDVKCYFRDFEHLRRLF